MGIWRDSRYRLDFRRGTRVVGGIKSMETRILITHACLGRCHDLEAVGRNEVLG